MNNGRSRSIGRMLWVLTLLSAACYAVLWRLGPQYALSVPCEERPLLGVLAVYAIACVLYLVALAFFLQRESSWRLFWWIVGSSLVFRMLLLPTPPLQEIDIYRYLWDGAVLQHGHDPYAYPPQAVIARLEKPIVGANDSLTELATIAADDPAIEEVLRTLHFGALTTPYPPVSQIVFAASSWVTPEGSSAETRLELLKGVLTLFDIATLLLLIRILIRVGKPIGWAIAYGWCPLLLKEIAGSGHLDAIAIFWTTAAVALWVEVSNKNHSASVRGWTACGSALLLSLGVAAKLYPAVLAPLILMTIWRRVGMRSALLAGVVFIIGTNAAMAPMFAHKSFWPEEENIALVEADGHHVNAAVESLPPPPSDSLTGSSEVEAPSGLQAFLSTWEMNDFLFMLVFENLRPQAMADPAQVPWFDVTPESFNRKVADAYKQYVPGGAKLTDSEAMFLLSRFATALVFIVIALGLAWRASRKESDAIDWLCAAFLTLAWFWLLAPTQNPWYWCWALPLVSFARCRTCLLFSVVCFAYYLRFWYECYYPASMAEGAVPGTTYDGSHFFYYVVVWWEFAPLLLLLTAESIWLSLRSSSSLLGRSQNNTGE